MLDDRSYMRSTPHRQPGMTVTVALLLANTVIFVVQSLVEFYISPYFIREYFYLSTGGLARGFIWQLVTYQFLHGGLLHLLLNLLVIYFFASPLEDALGRKGLLKLYLAGGILGGLLQMTLAALIPHFNAPVVGASAGCFALVAAFATLYPDRPLTLLLFFIIPVSMRARTLLWISIGLGVFGILIPDSNVAHAAHLGGIAAGVGFIWLMHHPAWPRWSSTQRSSRRPRELVRTASNRNSLWSRPKTSPAEELPPEEFISREVDPILDKISAHGIHSLTERERRILEQARAKMAKR